MQGSDRVPHHPFTQRMFKPHAQRYRRHRRTQANRGFHIFRKALRAVTAAHDDHRQAGKRAFQQAADALRFIVATQSLGINHEQAVTVRIIHHHAQRHERLWFRLNRAAQPRQFIRYRAIFIRARQHHPKPAPHQCCWYIVNWTKNLHSRTLFLQLLEE
jgi:hypothetical protein